jgi:hypothetical protein
MTAAPIVELVLEESRHPRQWLTHDVLHRERMELLEYQGHDNGNQGHAVTPSWKRK